MPKFRWEGFTKEGKKLRGSTNAPSRRDVKSIMRREGIRVVKLEEPSIFEADLDQMMIDAGLVQPFGQAELAKFTKQLSILLSSGVPILESFEILYKQEKNPRFKNIIKNVSLDVGAGATFNDALAKQKGFDTLYTSLIKAGESAGILDGILEKLSEFMDKQQKIKSQLKGAMMYPTIVSIVGIGVVYGMMIFVVPTFVEMLEETGQELPFITKLVIDISDFLQEWTGPAIPVIAVLFFIFKRWKNGSGKESWDLITMRIPIFGVVIVKGNLASFTRTMATMINAGVPLLECLDICLATLDNTKIAKDLKQVQIAITEGKTMAEPLKKIEYFPEMVAQMVKVGEATGSLDEMLVRCADVFEEEVDSALGSATKMIEPIILVVLGGIVGTILIAMYLPMFKSAG